MKTVISKCTCKNEWQDKEYKGLRVMNPTSHKPNPDHRTYRCTVCSKTYILKDK